MNSSLPHEESMWIIHNIHISTGCQQVSIIHILTKQFQKRGESPTEMILQGCHPVSWHGGRRRVAETIDGTKKLGLIFFWRACLSHFFGGKNWVKVCTQRFCRWNFLDQCFSYRARGAISQVNIKECIMFPDVITVHWWSVRCGVKHHVNIVYCQGYWPAQAFLWGFDWC